MNNAARYFTKTCNFDSAKPSGFVRLLLVALVFCCVSCSSIQTSVIQTKAKPGLNNIEHIIVIYAENRSFDNLYGLFPSANGINQAVPEQYIQVDHDGKPFKELPPIWASEPGKPPLAEHLPNRPFRIDSQMLNLPLSVNTRDLVHRYYQNIEQINGGKNNKFAAISDAGGLVMGYYDGAKLPLWQWAKDYVLADNFFMSAFGGSFLNHQWLICACTPYEPTAPQEDRTVLNELGLAKRQADSPKSAMLGAPKFISNNAPFTPDGFVVLPKQGIAVLPTRQNIRCLHRPARP